MTDTATIDRHVFDLIYDAGALTSREITAAVFGVVTSRSRREVGEALYRLEQCGLIECEQYDDRKELWHGVFPQPVLWQCLKTADTTNRVDHFAEFEAAYRNEEDR